MATVTEPAMEYGKGTPSWLEEEHPRDDSGEFRLKVSKVGGPKGPTFENLGGKQQGLFQTSGEPGQRNLFGDVGVPEDMVQKTPEGKPVSAGPTGKEKLPDSSQTEPTSKAAKFADFRKRYLEAWKQLNKYTPKEIEFDEWSKKMAAISDENPSWAEMVEDEGAPAKEPDKPKGMLFAKRYAKEGENGGGWKMLGSAPVFVEDDGRITKGPEWIVNGKYYYQYQKF